MIPNSSEAIENGNELFKCWFNYETLFSKELKKESLIRLFDCEKKILNRTETIITYPWAAKLYKPMCWVFYIVSLGEGCHMWKNWRRVRKELWRHNRAGRITWMENIFGGGFELCMGALVFVERDILTKT